MHSAVRILVTQGVDVWFSFEEDALLDEEGLGEVKYEILDSLLKESGW